ncbi:MAG: T9SS type A sorting domain-containing protein [Flavobacteriales bacterium]|nr:T9SS type A sorting domain-containing protein [Flavobacteriales bacterium]
MSGSLRHLLLATFLPASILASAQISFGGRPLGLIPGGPYLPEPASISLPEVNAAQLKAEDEERVAQGIKAPWRFGYNHEVDLGTGNSGTWHTLRNGDRVWRLSVECPGAFSINFRFDQYAVPTGARVFVYNDLGDVLGAYTAQSAAGRSRMGVQHIRGSRMTIEYHEPASVSGQGALHIDRITHGYRDVFNMLKDFGESGSCNINVICPEGDDWRDQIRSVAMITTGGSGFCTGTMLNNCALDSTPYFLTANHCLGPDVADWVFLWNWDSPVCDPTENAPMNESVSGCTLLTSNVGTDMAFLELSSIPPDSFNVFWSGWDKSGNFPDSVCGIHHPRGDIKKISRSFSTIQQDNIDVGNGAADCWQVTVWDEGTTEPGSSGSGLWNAGHLLIGQLYGGQAACGNSVNDYYGRFDVSFPFLEQWLGTCGDSLGGLGDTTFIEEPIHFDAAVTSIIGVPELVCGAGEIAPGITLKNNGDVVLTAITVTYGLAGGTTYVYDWTGSLQPGQTVNLNLPPIPVTAGTHTLEVSSSAPNGNMDQVETNDLWSYTFTVSNPQGNIALLLTLDNYGSDVTWTLETDIGTLLYGGGPYEDFEPGLVDTITWCLTNGCYIFTIYDAFGDGICCAEGNGGYEIMNMANSTIITSSNGVYLDENVSEFCVTVVGTEEIAAGGMQVYPNPTEGLLHVRFNDLSQVEAIDLFDAMGRAVLRTGGLNGRTSLSLDMHGLAAGSYTLVALVQGMRVAQRVVLQP